jgi:hypothetical protein
VTVGTLKTAQDLEAGGLSRQQAEAVAKAIADTGLTTAKRDVDVLKWMVGVVTVLVVAILWQMFMLDATVTRLDERVATLGDRMDKVGTRLGGIENRLGAIENRLGPRP